MNRYYYITFQFFPDTFQGKSQIGSKKNERVGVSLSMRLCTLQIGIHFLKDSGFRALVSRPRSFR